MLYQRISTTYTNSDEKQEYEDRWHGSEASYLLLNPKNRTVRYWMPDEEYSGEPRCDYLIYVQDLSVVRFVELKGSDASGRAYRCCRTTWAHGFHQLEATYDNYQDWGMLDPEDDVSFVLCTSMSAARQPAARYKNYPRYRSLFQKAKGKVRVMYAGEEDVLM